YPTESSVISANQLVFGDKDDLSPPTVLDEVYVSFRGKSCSLKVSDQVLFPWPSFDIIGSAELQWPVEEDWVNFRLGVKWVEASGLLCIAFTGGDGATSYLGAVILKEGRLVGINMKGLDGEDNANGYAGEALSGYVPLEK